MTRHLCKANPTLQHTKAFVVDGLDTKPILSPYLRIVGVELSYTNCFVGSLLYTKKSQCANVANSNCQFPMEDAA